MDFILPAALWPRGDSASKRNGMEDGWVGFINDMGSVKITSLTTVFGKTVCTVRD